MRGAEMGGFSAVCRAAGAPRASSQANPGARGGLKSKVLLELQWQGRGGKFRHLALSSLGLRRVLGTFGVVVLLALALAVVMTFSMRLNRVQAHFGVDAVLRENAELKVRQDVLRQRAFDLAEELYWRVGQGRRLAWMAHSTGNAWKGQCPRPPARDSGDEAILAWLSEQGVRLEALENAFARGRPEMGVMQASASMPVNSGTVPVRNAAVLLVADMGSARRPEAAPAKR